MTDTSISVVLAAMAHDETLHATLSPQRPFMMVAESLLAEETERISCGFSATGGALLGCSGIFSISRFASAQASRFFDVINTYETPGKNGTTYLLAPNTMASGHTDCHFPDIRNLLSLESIQIRLNSRTRVLKILGS